MTLLIHQSSDIVNPTNYLITLTIQTTKMLVTYLLILYLLVINKVAITVLRYPPNAAGEERCGGRRGKKDSDSSFELPTEQRKMIR
jgi:hypothetical protein